MNKTPLCGCYVLRPGALAGVGLLLLTGCQPALPPSEEPGTQQVEDQYFSGTQAGSGQRLAAGGRIDLPGGGSIGLPRSSPAGAEVSIAQGSLKPEAIERFQEWNPDTALAGSVLKISVRADAQAPPYVILRLPASGQTDRIFVAGYLDEDTSDLDWGPVPGTFDPATGLVTAAVGLGLFQPLEQDAAVAAGKGATVLQSAGPITYTGYVGVAVGGQQFEAQVVFIAEEPTGPLEVPFEGPPIAVRGRMGLRLSNITHQPLETLTVTSDFGPRRQPRQGASTNHRGTDYRATDGTTVYAAGDGTVVRASCDGASVNCGRKANGDISGGFIVEIDHGNGEVTRYLHMTNPASVGAGPVTGGQVIGQSDSTGGVAAHLHFEVKQNGTAVDPESIFDATVTATIAMAIDHQIQTGTEQQVPITRGIIQPQDMTAYVNIVELTGVEPGEHSLQFVLVEPSGTLRVLADVPLTVGEPFLGLTGAELYFSDITRYYPPPTDAGIGRTKYFTERVEIVYSLVAIDGSRLQGQAHLTFFKFLEDSSPGSGFLCPTTTYSVGPLEWDLFVEGTYQIGTDGTIYVPVFDVTPPNGPDYTINWTHPGPDCSYLDTSDLIPGFYWSGGGGTLVNGLYDYRRDDELQSLESGEAFYEIHMRWTAPP